MSALIKPEGRPDILGMLVLINPRCPHYEISFGGKNSGITGLDVAGSLAGLPDHVQKYAFLLGEGLKVDTTYDFTVIDDKGRPAVIQSTVRSGDFYRVKNALRVLVECQLVTSKVVPKTATIPKIADGLAGCALFQKVKAKGHCKQCDGQGWAFFDHKPKTCPVCDGAGQARYSLDERVKLAGLGMARNNYQKTWEKFEQWAFSELCDWDNQIRDKLVSLFKPA